ncbi:MAG: deoxyguanosinetriphosphate triphosphohydrolase [Deltaproteobacteria bacterium]|nr:deoxyguanosinetriphosphate triphosphohydrolase [Deltaproteobacteria bacterium]
MKIREETERIEHIILCEYATFSDKSKGRLREERPCPIRAAFQHDRDKILHSKAFRRLKHKTQVFLAPVGDHYRTRLTHTLEVSQIARTIARALRLNEDLTEAIALGHDLGHTPFGHAGERVLNNILKDKGGFHHTVQSLRVVDLIERDGNGLNLTYETRDGILKHSKGKGNIYGQKENNSNPETLEGEIVRLSDLIAYVNHDIDDALRAGILQVDERLSRLLNIIGKTHSERINNLVIDTIQNSIFDKEPHIRMSDKMYIALKELRDYLFEKVYENPIVNAELVKAQRVIEELYNYFISHKDEFYERYSMKYCVSEELDRAVVDYISGMTDGFAMELYEKLFIPRGWSIY